MKKKTVLTALTLVLVLAGAWFGYKKLSEKYRPDGQPAETAANETVPALTEDSSEAPAAPETAPSSDDQPEGDAAADDLPEGDAEAGMTDPEDLPEGDADADELPEGDADAEITDPADLPEGDGNVNTAPDFTVLDMAGQEVRLSDLFGKPILINFWATWCPPCRAELPYFEEAYQNYGEDIVFLMVDLTDGSRETIDGVKAFAGENGYSFPVYYDTEYNAAIAYGINAIPQTYAIGRDGNILLYQIGSMTKDALKSFTDALLGE